MIRDLFFTLLLLTLACPLAAQHRDTVYVERETVTYDTITVYDTVRVHDTSGSSTVRNMLTICRLRTH